MWKRLRQWWNAELDLAHLRHLDDRLMADIGLNREGLRPKVMGKSPQDETAARPLRTEKAQHVSDCRHARQSAGL